MELTIPSNISEKSPWLNTMMCGLSHMTKYVPGCAVRKEIMQLINDVPRWQQGTLLKFNGHWLYLDVWDYGCPSQQIIERMERYANEQAHIPLPHHKIEAIIKIQSRADWTNSIDLPVVPWTMFHTDGINWWANQAEYRNRYAETPKTFKAGCTGRVWGRRVQWFEYMRNLEWIDSGSWPGRKRLGETGDYVTRSCQWEVGIILQGQHDARTEAKNRREVEFASMGIPMILNYKPTYLNPLIPGVHYEYVEKPEGLKDTVDRMINSGQDYAGPAYQWWLENASIEGVCRTFIQLMGKLGFAVCKSQP